MNTYVPNIGTLKFGKQMLMKGEIDNNIIIIVDSISHF